MSDADRHLFGIVGAAVLCLSPATVVVAADYLSIDAAQRTIFPEADAFVPALRSLTPAQKQHIAALAGQQPPHGTLLICAQRAPGRTSATYSSTKCSAGRISLLTHLASTLRENCAPSKFCRTVKVTVVKLAMRPANSLRTAMDSMNSSSERTSRTFLAQHSRPNMSRKVFAGWSRCGKRRLQASERLRFTATCACAPNNFAESCRSGCVTRSM